MKLLNKIIAIVLLVTFPILAFADEAPKIKPMNQGEIAPFPGVLFNSSAVAQSIAEKEYNDEQCRLRIGYIEQKEDVFLIEESGSEERELYDEDEFIDWVVDVIYCIYDDDGGHIGDPFDIGFHDQICELLEIKNK